MAKEDKKIKNICKKCGGPTVTTQSSQVNKSEKCLRCGHKKLLTDNC